MHPFPFPFRSPLSGPSVPPATGGAVPSLLNGDRPGVPDTRTEGLAWTELEATLAGPAGAQALAELTASLEEERQALEQKAESMTLDRPGFGMTQAYQDALEAALGFLANLSARK